MFVCKAMYTQMLLKQALDRHSEVAAVLQEAPRTTAASLIETEDDDTQARIRYVKNEKFMKVSSVVYSSLSGTGVACA